MTDPIREMMSATLRRLNEAMDEQGWDQAPALWAITRHLNSGGAGPDGAILWLDRITSDEMFAGGGPPVFVLESLADEASKDVWPPPPEKGLLALAFVSEAWMVLAPDEADHEAALNHTMSKRPRRIEARIITAIDTAGVQYTHLISRDPQRYGRAEASHGPGDEEDGFTVGGAVPDALARLLEAWV